jgi:D-3-phosphoglycerate dehydrogenase
MRVIGYDPFITTERAANLQVELVTQEQLFRDSDFITLHIPLSESTKSSIGAREIAMMKPMARIINTARGGLIDEEVLVEAIDEKKIAGAAIDVFPNEPCTESILFKSENIIVTPHLGASTTEAQTLAATEIAKQIIDVFNGQPASYAVNAPLISAEALPVLAPFLKVAGTLGSLASYLGEGQMKSLQIDFQGEIASYDTTVLKAAVIGGLLNRSTEERINIVNASMIASKRGIKVLEQKEATCENYSNLITLDVTTSEGITTVSGTVLGDETRIVRVNNYSIDIVPTGGYFLFSDHQDRPGLIGAVGKITGDADINISYMHLSRLKPRGQALMILALDEQLSDDQINKILALPDVKTAKVVRI